MILNFQEIIHFWFTEIDPKSWWTKSSNFDESLRLRFAQIHTAANSCELWQWRKDPLGRLAEILILDQFSRNMFRDLAGSFASDPLALALAQEAVACGADLQLPTPEHRLFLYMPFMHSESRAIHQAGNRAHPARQPEGGAACHVGSREPECGLRRLQESPRQSDLAGKADQHRRGQRLLHGQAGRVWQERQLPDTQSCCADRRWAKHVHLADQRKAGGFPCVECGKYRKAARDAYRLGAGCLEDHRHRCLIKGGTTELVPPPSPR